MNKETVRRASSFTESQEIKIRHDAFWGYDINDRLGAEISVGYQGDDIDAFVFGGSVSWYPTEISASRWVGTSLPTKGERQNGMEPPESS